LAKPRDIFDHVEWLVEGGKYADALEIVETNRSHYIQRLRDEAMLDIGLKYLHSLFVKKDFVTAALICPKILKTKDLWEEWVYKFADQHQIKSIYALIPIDNPVLSHSVYEMVLSEFLNTDLRIYLDIIQAWPSTIYSVETMIKAVEMNLDGANLNLVHRILMELCMKAQQYEKATYYGMLLREPGQVELIKIHNLINFLQSNVLLLLEYERDLIPKPMFENTNVVDPVKLIRDLQSCVGVELLITHTDHVPVFFVNSSLPKS
jgi:hypothetical protein